MKRLRLLLAVTAVASALALVAPVAANAQTDPPSIVVEDGLTQPVFDFASAIEERVWVEIPDTDTNSDGVLDRVAIDISRPAETETADFDVPVIMELSPYRSGTWGAVPYHDDLDPAELPQSVFTHPADGAGPRADLPGSLDNYYVPRGYAVVIGQSVGTAQSTGCATTGDEAETNSAKAVIDWLNGRGTAYDAAEGGNAVDDPDWTTGAVGMTGASYNGTIPNQVATTGVEGLKTIVPVVAISDWYGYYRENGLVVAPGTFQGEDADVLARYVSGQARSLGDCFDEFAQIEADQDRATGDYNAFWDARNYLPEAGGVEASVFIVDGRNDWNVKPSQWGQWWDALERANVPRKIWLHNGGHGSPGNNAPVTLPDGQTWTYQQTVHRWFDHWLWEVDNGIMDEPTAILQREDGSNTTYPDWPHPAAQDVRLQLGAPGGDQPGTLGGSPARSLRQGQSFVDNGKVRRACSVSCLNQSSTNPTQGQYLVANPDQADPNRLVYVSEPLPQGAQMSGTPEITVHASVDNASAANLTAYLMDYGPPGSTTFTMVTRGWMDVQNRTDRARTLPIKQGVTYPFRFELHPDDYIWQPGHRIGVVIMSTDYEFTLRPDPGTQLTVQPSRSSLTLPLIGGL